MKNFISRNMRNFILSVLSVVALFVFTHTVSAGTLTNFSYSAPDYGVSATTDYTFNYTLETADPNMIFYASWPAGFDLTSSSAAVTINSTPSVVNEYWNGGGSGNTYIRLADPTAAAGAEISVTISDVINPSAGGAYNFSFFRTADGGGSALDEPVTINPINIDSIPFSGQGTGIIGDPYLVANCVQLQEVSNNLSAYYELANDIDCSDTENWNGGKGFDPIGDVNNAFTGTFDGEGYEISNMTIDRADDTFGQGLDDESYVGIFAYALNATIKNIDVVSSKVKGHIYVGGIVGYEADSTLENLTFNIGTTDNDCDPGHCVWARFGEFGGGIVGYMNGGTITNVATAGPVKGSGILIGGIVGHMENATLTDATSSSNIDGGEYLGGIVGRAMGSTITDAHATGNVLVVEEQTSGKQGGFGGGLVGIADGVDISNSSATGTVIGLGNIGGFVGSIFNSEISTSFATGEVTASSSPSGGFAGFSGCGSSFYQVYATGNVNGNGYAGGFSGDDGCEGPGSTFSQAYATGNVVSINDYAGGFLGRSNVSTFNDVYSLGNVSGTNYTGGFLGRSSGSIISNVYSAGTVTSSGDSYIGGFIGENNDEASHSFWDGDKSELEVGCGDAGPCVGVTESTTLLMNVLSTFTDASWDFETIWGMNGTDNSGYPFFQYQDFTSAPILDLVLTQVTPIPSQVTAANAIYYFSVSSDIDTASENETGQYISEAPTNCANCEIVISPINHALSFTGLQVGDVLEFNFGFQTQTQFSNMLHIGPFTVVAPASQGSSSGYSSALAWTPSTISQSKPGSEEKKTCPADQILTQNLKSGARNGKYHSYTKGIVKEVKILQAHMNRFGFNSGPVDGVLGKLTDGAIKRMQKFLNTKQDGLVGPVTRELINNSCGSNGLVL